MNKQIIDILKELKSRGGRLYVADGGLKLDIKKEMMTLELRNAIAQHKTELLELLGANESYHTITRVVEAEHYALSSAQQRLWILSQFEGGQEAYNIIAYHELDESYAPSVLADAINVVIGRHEILRTVFRKEANGIPQQWILSAEELNFNVQRPDFAEEANSADLLESYISETGSKPYDLENGPLIRASIIKVKANKHVLYYSMHHIISDAWSMDVLMKDVVQAYQMLTSEATAQLSDLSIQYKDYAAWQISELKSGQGEKQRDFWKEHLSGELTPLEFPASNPRPKAKQYAGRTLGLTFDKHVSEKFTAFCSATGGSTFMGALTCWSVFCSRYTGQERIVVGTPVAGRDHADLEDQIGCFVNTLAISTTVDAQAGFASVLKYVKENTLAAFANQNYPFDAVVDDLGVTRDTSRNAIFDTMLTVENRKTADFSVSNDEANQVLDYGVGIAKFDLDITFSEVGDHLTLAINYDTDLYPKLAIENMIGHFRNLLQQMLALPDEPVCKIDYLGAEERKKVLFDFNDNKVDYPRDKTVVHLFKERAAAAPSHTAVVFGELQLTYAELDAQSDEMAHYLMSNYGVQPLDRIAIKLGRDDRFIVSTLGVLKACAAYVPIDPLYPQSRIDGIENDSGCKTRIDDAEWKKFVDARVENSEIPELQLPSPEQMAYLIYTSGSSGKPKGVMISHGSLMNMSAWHATCYDVTPNSRATMVANTGFDGSVGEFFPYITTGVTMYPLIEEERLDGNKLVNIYNKHQITHSFLPTAMYQNHIDVFDKIEQPIKLIVGGEALDKFDLPTNVELYNHYGPTENTVLISGTQVTEDYTSGANIGKPISNVAAYILDRHLQLCPIGVAGEICVAGESLADGYHNRPDLTNEKFIESPFTAGERIYRTGDLGRWRSDGGIDFLGRIDNQIKVRGYRIELGEIEASLRSFEEIVDAIVLAIPDQNGENRLVAYIVSANETDVANIKAMLLEALPSYMVPTHFVQLKELPTTANGKIDRKALPNPEEAGTSTGSEYVAPSSDYEQRVAEIVARIVGRPVSEIGVLDNFFDIGLNSLKIMSLSTEIQKAFDATIPIVLFFQYATIRDLIGFVMQSKEEEQEEWEEVDLAEELDEFIDFMEE